MAITPDTKDWTWVLKRPCPECGLDTSMFSAQDVPQMLLANVALWQDVLLSGSDTVRTRPDPDTWSPLEYGCHVRDVMRLYDQRLQLMLTEDDPLFPNWDQDATAIAERYGEQEPIPVAVELNEAAQVLAARFADVSGLQWQRPGRRSDGAEFTIETFAKYFVHDPIHHLHDAARGKVSGG